MNEESIYRNSNHFERLANELEAIAEVLASNPGPAALEYMAHKLHSLAADARALAEHGKDLNDDEARILAQSRLLREELMLDLLELHAAALAERELERAKDTRLSDCTG